MECIGDDRKYNVQRVLLIVLLALQFLLVISINVFKSEQMLGFDSSLAIRHSVEMWKNKNIFLDNFQYFSTIEIDNAAFFAAPLYLLSGNLGVSLAVVHALLYIVTFLVCCDIFKNLKMNVMCGALATALIFSPYAVGELEWSNMLFFVIGQYEFRIIVMLLLVDLLIMLANGLGGKRLVLVFSLCIAGSFWTSLSAGNYVLLMIVFPVFLWFVVKSIKEHEIELDLKQFLALLIVIAVCVFGWKLHDYFVGVSFNNEKTLIAALDFWKNIGNAILGVYMLFGGIGLFEGCSIFSLEGIARLLQFAFITICLFSVGMAIIKKKHHDLFQMFLAVAAVNLGVLFLTDTTYGSPVFEHRYHIIWCSFLLLCVGGLAGAERNKVWKRIFGISCILLLLVVNVVRGVHIFTTENGNALCEKIIDVAEGKKTNSIYLYNRKTEAHVIRATELEKYCVSLSFVDGKIATDIGDFYNDYGDRNIAGKKNIMIISKEEFEQLPDYIKVNYQFTEMVSEELCVYYTEDNPWDGISGLPRGEKKVSVDFPYSEGYESTGVYQEGRLVIEDMEGCALYGPYADSVEGTYDVLFYYEPLEGGEPQGEVDVCTDGGEQRLAVKKLKSSGGVTKLKDVYIPGGKKVQFRLWVSQESKLIFKKIKIVRKKSN